MCAVNDFFVQKKIHVYCIHTLYVVKFSLEKNIKIKILIYTIININHKYVLQLIHYHVSRCFIKYQYSITIII